MQTVRRTRAGGLAVFVCAVALLGCVQDEPLRPGDEKLVLTVEDLSAFGLDLPKNHRDHETLRRERQLGGTVAIEYTLALPDDMPPYVYSLAELHSSRADACRSFAANNLGLWVSQLEIRERDDLFEYGDRSRFGIIESAGRPVGNLFSMCKARAALVVMFVGIFFDDADSWRDLITPRLDALAAAAAD